MTSQTKAAIGATRDSAYMAINEVMALAATAMETQGCESLLVISISGHQETALIGGVVTGELIERLESLLGELKRRAATEGDGDLVLHVWR